MYPVDFDKRLATVNDGNKIDINCHATTFYLLGLKSKEVLVDINMREDAATLRKRFDIIARAQVPVLKAPEGSHAFVIWHKDEDGKKSKYWHSGIVHPEDNKMIIHRMMPGVPVVVESLSELLSNRPYATKPPSYVELQFLRLKPVVEE